MDDLGNRARLVLPLGAGGCRSGNSRVGIPPADGFLVSLCADHAEQAVHQGWEVLAADAER